MGRLPRKLRFAHAVIANHIRKTGSAKKGLSLARDVPFYEFREVVQFVLPAITHPGHPVFGTSYVTSLSEPALRIVPSESVTRALDPISEDVSCACFGDYRLSTDISPRHCPVHGAPVLPCLRVKISEIQNLTKAHSLAPLKSFYSYV